MFACGNPKRFAVSFRCKTQTNKILTMNPAHVLEQIRKFKDNLEALKAPIDPEEPVNDQQVEY
jgi:hypothetical protein